MKKAKKRKQGLSTRPDGRRALLLYFKPEITVQLKRAALESSRPAYELAEEAIQLWLKRYKNS
jgi:hypothetical protein